MGPIVTGISAPSEMEVGKAYTVTLTYHDDNGDAVSAIITNNGFPISAMAVPDGTDGAVSASFTCNEAGQSLLFSGSVTDSMNVTSASSQSARATCVSGSGNPSPPEPTPPSGNTDQGMATLAGTQGTVNINSRTGAVGMRISYWDLIEVAPGGSATIVLDDTHGAISLSGGIEGASIKIPKPQSALQLTIKLIRGIFGFDDTKNSHPMTQREVEAANVTVSIEGTIFSIDSNSQHDQISITSGKIKITPNNTSLRSFTLDAGNQVTVSSNSVSPVTTIGGATVPTPSPTGGSSLKSFDKNKNNVLDNDEFFAVVDAWVASQIDNAMFFKAVDLWISQGQITASGTTEKPVQLSIARLDLPTKYHMEFETKGEPVSDLDIAVFDLQGHTVFTQDVAGPTLSWNMLSENGRPVANGIYLCQIIAHGEQGKILMNEVKKLMVMN
ncbi:FecR domain-containing protein [Candidatus Acetothermia bacterium]|nr:FecR domain-containing protein [Candidatus Acetothermia bacterium]